MKSDHYSDLQKIVGPVSRETFEALVHFESVFLKWSKRINLASPASLPLLWQRHILDSAQIMALLGDVRSCVDLGSGGGFPGAVIAILARDNPDVSVHLIESDTRKAAFLATVLGQTAPTAIIHPIRVEQAVATISCPDVVTARAFAPLPRLLDLVNTWLSSRARGLLHKGRDFQAELEKSRNTWRFDLIQHPSATDAASFIVEIANLKKIA